MPVRVKNCHRNALVKALQAEGIAAMPWWAGYNRHLDFSDRPGIDLSAARTLKDTIVSLPIHQYLGTVETVSYTHLDVYKRQHSHPAQHGL